VDASAAALEIHRDLRATRDPVRAAQEKRYLKSDLEHLGVPMPAIRAIAKRFARAHLDASRSDVLRLIRELWKPPVHELRMIAIELLLLFLPKMQAKEMDLVERLIRESKTWAFVDVLAANVAGDLVARFPDLVPTLDRWATDEDFWIRRAAMLTLLKPLRRGDGDFDRFARYAEEMLGEREFFIRKAIGWILRETSKKRPELVYEWLAPRAASASGVTVREAVKYLPEPQRAEIMRSYRAGSTSASRRPSSGTRRRAR
jgi:3-methyladenine DNA glycosylase AlkD